MVRQVPDVTPGSRCAHGVLGTPHGKVQNTHPRQMKLMSSLTILVADIPIFKSSSSLGVTLYMSLGPTPTMHCQIWHTSKGVVPKWSINDLRSFPWT